MARALGTQSTQLERRLFYKNPIPTYWFSIGIKIIKKYLQKGVARKEKGCTFASAIEENDIAKFFESNEPIKSSLKGKEPFNSKRLRKQVNPPGQNRR